MNAPSDPQLDSLRIPPHSIEAEQSVIGGLLRDNAAYDRIADFMHAEDFYRYDHRIIFAAIVVTAIIMSIVVPAFRQVFDSFGAPLPLPTLLVMGLSAFLVRYWLALLAALVLAALLLHLAWRRWPALRRHAQLQALRLPLFGPLLRKAAIARWTRTLAAMFAAGVPLLDTLDLVGAASGHAL